MRRINTLQELRIEKRRLLLRRRELETEIRISYAEIKASFEPANVITKGTEKILGHKENHLLGNSVGQVANYVAKLALRKSGFLSRLIVPYLIKSTASNIVENHKAEIFDWVGRMVSRVAGKKGKVHVAEQK
ncbi:MAG: hypothetical protein K0S32_925 [Bacteroidetes bacterium]|jgi:hypothetical protein|nr:hypothetical protein [Bacteroidota bacterium]